MDSSPRDPVRTCPLRSAHRAECIWAVLILILAGRFYLWTATSAGSLLSSTLQHDDLYNRLADEFLAGQLSIVEKPNSALADLHDPWDPARNLDVSRIGIALRR
jgi:hypothetical protein